MSYLKRISTLSVLIAMLLPVNPAWGQTAQQIYNDNCGNCHTIGVPIGGVRAPIANMQSANQADWNNRLTERGGIEGIYTAILEPAASSPLSYTTMCAGYSAEQCKQTTDYMIETLAGLSITRAPAVEDLYTTNCSSCHNNGTLNAPIANMQSANQANWNNRLKERGGYIEGIYDSILASPSSSTLSYKTMCASVEAEECKQITDYMIETLAGVSIVRESVVRDLYTTNCSSCHNNGTLVNGVNAPIANMESANQANWNNRLKERGGYIEGIYTAILEPAETSPLSYTTMCASVEDEECKQITDYMIATLAGVSIVRESVVRDLYNTNCSSCHNSGILNAPIANMESTNQANWKNRLKERDGIEGIYTAILEPQETSELTWKTMCSAVEAEECKQITDYMIATLAGVSTEPEPSGTQIKLKLLLEGAINSSSE